MSGVVRGVVCCPRPAHQRMSLRRQPVHEPCGSGIPPPKVAHNSLRSFFKSTQKRCNSNDLCPWFETLSWELRAKLLWFVAVVARAPVTAHVGPMTCTWALSTAR